VIVGAAAAQASRIWKRIMAHPERMICWTLCAWFCCASARPALGVDDFAFFHENVMGTSLELRVLADDRESARWAEDRVLGEIDRLALIFSGYDSASEFSRWQAAPRGPMSLSPELFEVLSASQPQCHRQGIYRRTRLRCRCGARPRPARPAAERWRRSSRPRRGPAHARHRCPVGGFGIDRADRDPRGQGSRRVHQRPLPARLSRERTFISLSGLVLLFYLKLRRIPGLVVAIIGTIIVLALFLLGVP
jgi:hypothetical protein